MSKPPNPAERKSACGIFCFLWLNFSDALPEHTFVNRVKKDTRYDSIVDYEMDSERKIWGWDFDLC
ncbi:hypothetical protein MU1_35200 [Paenibacillus glycanilyticus]|uniref:Uncharacterized protein n=1 Tax=Paenibacillus glycanilyticus TaxID=126569 RepID=A0ABQ6GGG7_9BACL|nr:hypothetical protein MU1_35200 [Paenibacillus glycanilyticus]